MSWGPWIEHDGKGCPCWGQPFEAIDEYGELVTGIGGEQGGASWDSKYREIYIMYLRYRIRKPKGLSILERIAQHPHKERIEA